MKNQSSISKPTVIIKPPAAQSSSSPASSVANSQAEPMHDETKKKTNASETTTVTNSSSTPLTDKEAKEQEIIIYEFHFPIELCGRLIGREGVHVDYIRQMSQVDLVVRDDAVSYEKQVVALHGRRTDIERAIELIAKRFPTARYPQVAFKPINKKIILRQRPPECVPIPPALAQLFLPDGIPTEVVVTSVVSCNHIFVQQILHPSYSELSRLDNSMSVFYHHTEATPLLPRPIQPGVICAAPTQAGWFRALITIYNTNDDMTMIKFLDYGGYLYVPANSLRALRQDFMVIPFQAVEVYLDNVVPSDNQEEFTSESIEAVKNMLLGFCFKAIVTGYHYDSNPFVQLTNRYGHARPVNADIQKMVHDHQQALPENSVPSPATAAAANALQQSVSDISTSSSSTFNSES